MKQAIIRIMQVVLATAMAAGWSGSRTAWPLPTIEQLVSHEAQLQLVVKKSGVLRFPYAVQRVSVVSTDVADVQILEPMQILVTANAVGETSLIIWTEDGKSQTMDVVVTWNIEQILRVLRTVMPDEAIEVMPLEDGIALRGSVSRIEYADQAVELAESFVPKVINLLAVPGQQQVLLKVRIAEVARSWGSDLGLDFRKLDRSVVGGSLLGDGISGNVASNSVNISDAVTLFLGFPHSNFDLFLRAMRNKGLLYVLAEPNLIARSGETASFLAGGEFPIPVVQGGTLTSSITIEYKEFGVRLNFTPTVVADHTIHMEIAPEVSDLDFSRGVSVSGYVIPIITTRRAKTVVSLDDGQTFAIAGLIKQSKENQYKRVPYVGDLPLFGHLFRSKHQSESESELLIMVTPHLIAPLPAGANYRLPTDDLFLDPAPRDEKLNDSERSTSHSRAKRSLQNSIHYANQDTRRTRALRETDIQQQPMPESQAIPSPVVSPQENADSSAIQRYQMAPVQIIRENLPPREIMQAGNEDGSEDSIIPHPPGDWFLPNHAGEENPSPLPEASSSSEDPPKPEM